MSIAPIAAGLINPLNPYYGNTAAQDRSLSRSAIEPVQTNLWRRLFDLSVSILALILLSPIILMVAAAIKMDSPGPIIYRQERVGRNNRHFTMYKFRSMIDRAEPHGPVWAQINDRRVTRIGKLLRQFRLDELPQLINVLKGEMSIIGPRPERPCFVQNISDTIPNFNSRHAVRPGITGLSQVVLPYCASIEDARKKFSFDLYYITHRSLVMDTIILAMTARVIILRQGAR